MSKEEYRADETADSPVQQLAQAFHQRFVDEPGCMVDFIHQGSVDGLAYWDLHQPEQRWFNDQFWHQTGYSDVNTMALNQRWLEHLGDGVLDLLRKTAATVGDQSGSCFELSMTWRHTSGELLTVDSRNLIFAHNTDQSVRVLSVLTVRKSPVRVMPTDFNQTPETDLFTHYVIDSSPHAILVIDTAGILVASNGKAEALFGYASGTLTGLRVGALVPSAIRNEHPALMAAFFKAPIARAIGVGRDLFGHRQDGVDIPIEVFFNPVIGHEKELVIVSVIDISERKTLEDRFRLALESAPTAMIMINAQGEISLINKQTESMFGYSRHELLGQPIDILVPESAKTAHPKLLQTFLQNPSTRSMGAGRDLMGRHKNGTEIPIEIGLNPINEGLKLEVIASITDISARSVQQQAISHYMAELELVNKELDHYAYIASHDLKAPLKGIGQLASWLEEDLADRLDDQTQQYLDLMKSRITRLEKLLDDLLAYSRAGWTHGKFIDLNCQQLIDDCFALANPPTGFTLHCQLGLASLTTLHIPLELIVRNLLHNAFKHHDKITGLITVTAEEQSDCYCFTVTDDGPGIPIQHHAKVFEIFQTLRPRDEIEGSGIGLALVKKVIDRYGGRIHIASNGLRGTTFVVTWPKEEKLRQLFKDV
ncbi:PAS domain-containing sensor histidine kinase [Reinekea sp.]|jgi:PAS domain S-box-containing protein|uniref:sensor histidine kinase n=1 Tax=Reinekea sp. TaxID=1970455 RepID=UPI002A7F7FB9|nr:PAS domain-containing sensor histidine kinase [Reinekea sp.]